ncbi:tRNA-specific 2-thiouridylase [Chytridium lagenaria]|nr:tRNA-specific 2-thiouridylase [Chytridium lagenaria]
MTETLHAIRIRGEDDGDDATEPSSDKLCAMQIGVTCIGVGRRRWGRVRWSSTWRDPKPGDRVVLGISGGVDSSVSAYLLKQQGYKVRAIYMRNWDTRDETNSCPSDQDYNDAQTEYWSWVFEDFVRELGEGATPNPDVGCNRYIKFDAFLKRSVREGEWVATGHYAKARDSIKDQTYYLSNVSSSALAKTLFPIGSMLKSDVKSLASRLGFPTAVKKESMGICFIGNGVLGDFIGDYVAMEPGAIVTVDGVGVGTHAGLARSWFFSYDNGVLIRYSKVVRFGKNTDTNTLIVAPGRDHPALFSASVVIKNMFWINGPPEFLIKYRGVCQISSQEPWVMAVITSNVDNVVSVEFRDPQWGVTPGQHVAVYVGDECLGEVDFESLFKGWTLGYRG